VETLINLCKIVSNINNLNVCSYEEALHPMGFKAVSIVDNEMAIGPRKVSSEKILLCWACRSNHAIYVTKFSLIGCIACSSTLIIHFTSSFFSLNSEKNEDR
jgi:hypothetical protein